MSDLDRVAKPGDPDLDCDIDGVTLTAVVVDGSEILARFTGGYGRWISVDGEEVEFAPGDPDSGVEEGELRLLLDRTQRFFDAYVERLERWRDCATPLRFCCAPGRMSTLIEDRKCWLPMPRKPHPDWVRDDA